MQNYELFENTYFHNINDLDISRALCLIQDDDFSVHTTHSVSFA